MTMNPFIRCSIFPSRLASLGVVIALASAAVLLAADDPTPPAAPKARVLILSSDEAVQKNLQDLDQLLEANPKFEEILRNNVDQLEQAEFRRSNPDLDLVLQQKPGIVYALKVERHFLIHRSVVRLARGPVLRPDVLALDDFLAEHPAVRKALEKDPAQIVQSSFLIAHPNLADFFTAHPGLSTVLLEKQGATAGSKKR